DSSAPGINQDQGQNADEDGDFHKVQPGVALAVSQQDREEKEHVHVKGQEQQGEQIIDDRHLNPGAADDRHAALINVVPGGAVTPGGNQVGQDDGAQGEQGGPHQEDQDEGEIAQGLRDFQDRLLVLFGTTLTFIPRRKILVKEFVTG